MPELMGSGLDLQAQCYCLHVFLPPLSERASIQANERAIRFEQSYRCLAIEYLVGSTSNWLGAASTTSSALVSEAALTTGELLAAEENERSICVSARSRELGCWTVRK